MQVFEGGACDNGGEGKTRFEIDTHEGYGAVFQKDSPLIPFVSKAINKLQKDGTISKLTKHWFGFDPSKVPVLK